jgi:AcrR family transcriptional regulator
MCPRPSVETERRQQILDAALTCFSRTGYHQTSMDDLAAELPFSKGLLYYYFPTKRDLFVSLLDNWAERSLQAWESMLSPTEEVVAQICKSIQYGVQLVALSSDLARIEFEFYSEVGRDADVSEAFRALFTQFRGRIRSILDSGVRSGSLRPLDTEALSAVLFGAYEGLALQAMVEPDAFDWALVSDSLCQLVLNGLSREDEIDDRTQA